MAMNLGPGGGAGDPDVMVEMNTTPLIDVMLVLLIMLIITIPIQLHSVHLDMPQGAPPPTTPPPAIRLEIEASGQLVWDGERLPDRAALEAHLRDVAVARPVTEVQLRPDPQAEYKVVAMVLASAQRLGVTQLGVVGNERFAAP